MKAVYEAPKPERWIWKCDHCMRTNVHRKTMERHEAMCLYNPRRSKCPECVGAKGYHLRVTVEGTTRDICTACEKWIDIQSRFKTGA